MKERWKPVVTYPLYQVSNHGRIRNREGRIMATRIAHGGLVCSLRDHLGQGAVRVARAVGEAFMPSFKPDKYPVFRDGNPGNCKTRNLKWVPRSAITIAPFKRNPKQISS